MVEKLFWPAVVTAIAVLFIGFMLGVVISPKKPAPCGQAAISLQPAGILEYKTIVCSFSEKDKNYFCSPWEPSAFRPNTGPLKTK